jgi:hypothetical protein
MAAYLGNLGIQIPAGKQEASALRHTLAPPAPSPPGKATEPSHQLVLGQNNFFPISDFSFSNFFSRV